MAELGQAKDPIPKGCRASRSHLRGRLPGCTAVALVIGLPGNRRGRKGYLGDGVLCPAREAGSFLK